MTDVLTCYYRLKLDKTSQRKSKRFDTVEFCGAYPPFEDIARGAKGKRFHCYLYRNNFDYSDWQKNGGLLAGLSISNGTHITNIQTFPEHPQLGFGDIKDRLDALLFKFNSDFTEMEIFVAVGMKYNIAQIFPMFVDGELDENIELLKRQAYEKR